MAVASLVRCTKLLGDRGLCSSTQSLAEVALPASRQWARYWERTCHHLYCNYSSSSTTLTSFSSSSQPIICDTCAPITFPPQPTERLATWCAKWVWRHLTLTTPSSKWIPPMPLRLNFSNHRAFAISRRSCSDTWSQRHSAYSLCCPGVTQQARHPLLPSQPGGHVATRFSLDISSCSSSFSQNMVLSGTGLTAPSSWAEELRDTRVGKESGTS